MIGSKQHRPASRSAGVEGLVGGGAEGDFGEACFADLAAEDRDLDPHQREAEEPAALPRAFELFEHDGEHVVRQAVVEHVGDRDRLDAFGERLDADADLGGMLPALDEAVALAGDLDLRSIVSR